MLGRNIIVLLPLFASVLAAPMIDNRLSGMSINKGLAIRGGGDEDAAEKGYSKRGVDEDAAEKGYSKRGVDEDAAEKGYSKRGVDEDAAEKGYSKRAGAA